MGVPTRVDSTITVTGKQFRQTRDLTPDMISFYVEKDLAAAKTGQLTTRTDNDTGTLTMTGGHGITTGVYLDVYWDGGFRLGLLVGTVATNSVPIDGGAGDNLPTNLTDITAMIPSSETLTTVGNDYGVLAADAPSNVRAGVLFTNASDVAQSALEIDPDQGAYVWDSGSGVTNPLAGVTTGKIKLSHGDSTGTRKVRAIGLRS
jgi:hypothetical protein